MGLVTEKFCLESDETISENATCPTKIVLVTVYRFTEIISDGDFRSGAAVHAISIVIPVGSMADHSRMILEEPEVPMHPSLLLNVILVWQELLNRLLNFLRSAHRNNETEQLIND
jgi:hypothetical protein